jgi:type II secretory pathway pseudopilin PulG
MALTSRRSGFSMIEAVTAVGLVVIACSAMLYSVSQAIQASDSSQNTNRANALAQDLMTEVSACRWADSDSPQHWGPEQGETNLGTRSAFDDLDDYDQWAGPVQTRSGVTYDALQYLLFPSVRSNEYAQYAARVAVEYVSSSGQVLVNGVSPYRRVTVTVTHPQDAPVTLRRVFTDVAPLLGSTYWHNPNAVEPVATVTVTSAGSGGSELLEDVGSLIGELLGGW